MTVIPARSELSTHLTGGRSTSWWGTMLLITNEVMLFASLFAAYLYLRFNSPAWPPAGVEPPELTIPLINTVILLSSSVFMHIAQNGIKRGDNRRLRINLGIAFVLAVVFLLLQAYEYSTSPIAPNDSAYASLFFAITGIHGMHVLIAVLLNGYVQALAGIGHFTANRRAGVENVTLYWHFVDAVWLFVLAIVYLSAHL